MARYVRFSLDGNPTYGVLDGTEVAVITPHPFMHHEPTGHRIPLEGLRLLAPVIPSKVVCVGRNYAAHAAELGNEVPGEPLLFLKPSSSVIGPDDPIRHPTWASNEVQHEAELAVVIGALVQDVDAKTAAMGMGNTGAPIFGFTCANDVTARDLQRSDKTWTRAKGFDSFLPLGPAITTDLDPSNVGVRCIVNGETRQDGSTKDLIFSVPELIAYISRIMTLLPGDIVLTGTPDGVSTIVPGDAVRVEIDGIGVLRNPVVDRAAEKSISGFVTSRPEQPEGA
jgi:2-keto-4-pentenoate hydratase/2-oxohepta-3-ene-1,7-dioic acid hydratase in catechol pathway